MSEAAVVAAELDGATITDSADAPNEGVEYESLFEGEDVSEEELKGEDATAEKPADAEPTGDEPEGDPEKKEEPEEKDDPEKKDGEGEEKKDKEEPVETDTIAKKAEGLQVALHQERSLTKDLKSQLQQRDAQLHQLVAEVTKLKAGPVDEGKFKDFKVLSKQQYLELNAEDPDKAAEYLFDLREYEKHQAIENNRQMAERNQQAAYQNLVNEGVRAMSEVLPGLYDNKNEDAPKIIKYAEDSGISGTLIDLLTDPSVKVTNHEGKQFVMGAGAAQFVKFLKGAYEASLNAPDTDKIREEIKAELMPKLEAKAQKSVMEKLKTDPNGAFRSLDQASTSTSKEVKPISGYVTEAQMAKLSEAEEAALLGAGA